MTMKILTKMLTDDGVYWGTPMSDGEGGSTYVAPVEISVRWVDKAVKFIGPGGEELVSKSVVYTSVDCDVGGLLKHTSLASLRSKDPSIETDVHKIKGFDKLPTLKGDQYLRTAYL